MVTYNWQKSDWPHFRYNLTIVQDLLFSIAEKAGLISGKLVHLDNKLQTEMWIDCMVEEAVKSSEIEGEYIDRPDVRSSIKNQLGLNSNLIKVKDKRAEGIAELMMNVRKTFKEPLTKMTLFNWHTMLLSGSNQKLKIGGWRRHKEPMQIISGRYGKSVVHFEAPPSDVIPIEMTKFIKWFNNTAPQQSEVIKFAAVRAAIAHLYFESIHPFEDGNGRIGRAIAEKVLSQGFGYPVSLSLSHIIEADKKSYYEALKSASKDNEITDWIYYFVNVVLNAQVHVEKQINFILKKSAFFDAYKNDLNERQLKVVRRMMESGDKGFEGGMSAKKYMGITSTSKATATRDLQQLLTMGAFKQKGSGRSVRYDLNWDSVRISGNKF